MSIPAPSQRFGPYELIQLIGKGGMGEVWRARDPRLGRDVAIKISAQQFTDRFEREARAIAALNHNNICTLYDVGPNYLVMEYIEGPTLAERIKEGPIPLEEALGYAKQIADALEAAHEKNIVHRDLKPANVKIRPDGSVKVLDFGLAKAGEAQEVTPDSPTMMPGTQMGMILGTAGYMSPEQARGKEVDKRADIWAFGVVLYEMVTGQRLFEGETVSDSLAAVLKQEPDLTLAPEKTRRLLRACLEKDPKQRLRDIGDVGRLLDTEGGSAAPLQSRFAKAGWITAGVFVASTAALALLVSRQAPAPVAGQKQILTIVPPSGTTLPMAGGGAPPEISPDGYFVLEGRLLRRLDSPDMAPLRGVDGISNAGFWSADSKSLVFPVRGVLKKMRVPDGAPEIVASIPFFMAGGSWSDNGILLISSGDRLYTGFGGWWRH